MTSIYGEVDQMARALTFHLERQNMIAANLANVDTPGYAPKEIVRDDFADESEFQVALRAATPGHFGQFAGDAQPNYEIVEEHNVVPGNDRNYVSLDHEMSRLSANSIRYEAVTRLVNHHLGILRYAVTNAQRN